MKIAWPLLVGIFLIMLGNGLQGTLISLRAYAEGFPLYATGIIMSAYYLGFLVGCIFAPKLIASVGHIRVFAGFASLASTTILIHGVFVDPWTWAFIRMLGGFSFVGLFVVAESWLNSIAPNKLRAEILSSYLLVVHAGLLGGQFFIDWISVEQIELFILVSIFISLSLVPITLANRPAPGYEEPEVMKFKNLFSFPKLPLAGIFTAGLCGAAILSIGPIYGEQSGMTERQIAFFISAYVLGATLIPMIIGKLSDIFDRRQMILIISIISLGASFTIAHYESYIITSIFILGGLIVSLYCVCAAFINDRLKPSQITSASAALIFLNGIGSCIGPVAAGFLIDIYDKNTLFWLVAAMFSITLLIGVYKTIFGKPLDIAKQKDFIQLPARASIMLAGILEETTKKKKKSP